MCPSNHDRETETPVGWSPSKVLYRLRDGDAIECVLPRLEPSIDNYRALALMIQGASVFIDDHEASRLDHAHDRVIAAWEDYLNDH